MSSASDYSSGVAVPPTSAYGPPKADFSNFSDALTNFVKGREEGRSEDQARLFRNGIPKTADGNFDINAATDMAAKAGGLTYAMPLLNMGIQSQQGQQAAGNIQSAASAAQGGPQASAAPAATPVQTAAGPVQSTPKVWGDQEAEDAGLYDPKPKPGVQVASLAPAAPGARPNAGPGIPAPTPAAVPQGAVAPQVAPQAAPTQVAQAAPQVQPSNETPSDPSLQQADRYASAQSFLRAKAAQVAAANPKLAETYNKTADDYGTKEQQLRTAAATAAQPTINMKDYQYAVAKGFKGTPDEWASQSEADKATAKERATNDVKEQQSYIDAGKQAGSRLATLNTIGNIVNSDKNLTLGYAGDTALKVKMALQQLGVPVGDLSGAEGIQKMNASLASEMAKSLSGRPTQFEFKSFMANNPGLLLDKTGNQRLIGIYSQLAKREYDLGKLARQNGDNWSKWDDVVEGYDNKHPITDPVSKKQISTNSIIAPGPDGPQGQAAAPAAPAQEGSMAINPKTGERLKLQGGKWVPFA